MELPPVGKPAFLQPFPKIIFVIGVFDTKPDKPFLSSGEIVKPLKSSSLKTSLD